MIGLAKPDIQKVDIENVVRVLESGFLVQGQYVKEVEEKIIKLTGSPYASLVSNGTASLHLALKALGIGRGDEVIVPALSYVATANVVELSGARCVFVDTDADTFNIHTGLIEDAVTPHTKAIMPVHEFGLCADMPFIMAVAKAHNLFVIEDAACAVGATFKGRHAGTFGDFGSYSFHPRKSITSGEGGCLVCRDSAMDTRIKTLRNHGIEPGSQPLNFTEAGFNYRMTDFQAALLKGQCDRLEGIIKKKRHLAALYLDTLKHPSVRLPRETQGALHTWQTFHIMLDTEAQRDGVMQYLAGHNVLTNYGAQCIPATSYYKKMYNFEAEKQFPNAYAAYTRGLALPVHDKLNEEDILYISKLINNYK